MESKRAIEILRDMAMPEYGCVMNEHKAADLGAEALELLEWADTISITAYRSRDPEHNTLYDHVVVVNEDVTPRGGNVYPSLMHALRAARAAQDAGKGKV